MSAVVPLWVEAVTAVLLVASGLFSLTGAVGLLRLQDFFQRMHPPTLAYTFGAWCVTLASIVYFSALDARPSLHVWVIIILLSITAPVTTILLARVGLFRRRRAGEDVPPPLRNGT
jgi:multicomponent K+:H+ antiporter subunit G